jgi:hypothetical protein
LGGVAGEDRVISPVARALPMTSGRRASKRRASMPPIGPKIIAEPAMKMVMCQASWNTENRPESLSLAVVSDRGGGKQRRDPIP